jgi:hypothetical protein
MQRHGPTAAAVLLLLFHLSSFDAGGRPLVTDVRYFVYFAWKVAHGAVPHLSFFENKTQLATFAGAFLVRVGEWIDVDPLTAIRGGYLAIAGLAGLAMFFIFRRLGGGAVAGGLGLLAYCSFGLLGVLPAVGNIPKLLMAVAASVAALLLHRRAWFLAGVAGALAFMDWQIGGLVGLAALVTAAVYGTPRLRAVLRVVAGGVAGLAPFIIYYLAHGALGQTVRQVVGSTLFRGSATLAGGQGIAGRVAKIRETVGLACPSHGWLFYLGLVGAALVAFLVWRKRNEDIGRLLLPLAVYHLGVVAFSLVDFQYYGDLFLLLHSVSFFLGALWVSLFELVAVRRIGPAPWVGAVMLAIVFILARPGFLRPRIDLVTPTAAPERIIRWPSSMRSSCCSSPAAPTRCRWPTGTFPPGPTTADRRATRFRKLGHACCSRPMPTWLLPHEPSVMIRCSGRVANSSA